MKMNTMRIVRVTYASFLYLHVYHAQIAHSVFHVKMALTLIQITHVCHVLQFLFASHASQVQIALFAHLLTLLIQVQSAVY